MKLSKQTCQTISDSLAFYYVGADKLGDKNKKTQIALAMKEFNQLEEEEK